MRWIDVFAVSLLVGDLAYGMGSARDEHVEVGILTGSLLAAAVAAILIGFRNRHYKAVGDEESRDSDHDGTPDVYQSPSL